MTTLILALFFAAILAAVVLIVVNAETKRHEIETAQFTRDDPRCAEVWRKLDDARRAMIARGTPLLLVDRAPWTRVSAGNVTSIRGRS